MAIVILWPLLYKLVRRNRPVPASVVPAHPSEVLLTEDAAIQADENTTPLQHNSHHNVRDNKEKP